MMDQPPKQAFFKIWVFRAVLLLLGVTSGVYVIYAQAVENDRLGVFLLALPVGFGLFSLPSAPRILMSVLVLSLSFSARFRLTGNGGFYAGAEAAIAPLDIPLVGLALIWSAEACISGRNFKIRLGSVGKAFLLLLGIYLLSLVYSHERTLTILAAIRLLKMGLLVLIVRNYVKSRQDVIFIISLLLICVVFQSMLAVFQTVSHSSLGLGFLGERDALWQISLGNVRFGRPGGTMGHSNALSNFLETLSPLALAFLLGRSSGFLRALSLVAFPAGMIGIFLTFSRAGWGSAVLGVGAVLLMSSVFGTMHRSKVILFGSVLLICLGIFGLLMAGIISQRITTFGSSSWLVRTGTIQVASNIVKQHPLLGVGVNNYMVVASQYVSPGLSPLFGGLIAHNLFYLVAAETGITGLAVFLALMLTIMLEGRRVIKADREIFSTIAIGILGGIVALLIHGMFDWLFFYDPIHVLFWFQVGLLLAVRDILSQNNKIVQIATQTG